MSAALRQPMTREAFLEWEERQPVKYEFDGFAPVAMVGVSVNHATVQANIIRHLGNRLAGGPCRVFGSDLKILAADSVRYPDAFVVCGQERGQDHIAANPVVVFEILSPTTQGIDRIVKNREYRDTPSIQRYVILEQDQQAATVFSRMDGAWIGVVLTGEEVIPLPELGTELPLSECYQGVAFPPLEADTA